MLDLIGLGLLVVSLVQGDMIRLRVAGIVCCVFYISYSMGTDNFAMLYPNAIILAVHLIKLIPEIRRHDQAIKSI